MPPTDNSAFLREASARRHDETVRRAHKALRLAARRGDAVTFRSIAQAAGVSKSWLYTQPDIRVEIDRLRAISSRSRGAPVRARDRMSEASLVRRIESLTDENGRLRLTINELRQALRDRDDELAIVHGELRQARQTRPRPSRS